MDSECMLVAVPDTETGERVHALLNVVPSYGPESIKLVAKMMLTSNYLGDVFANANALDFFVGIPMRLPSHSSSSDSLALSDPGSYGHRATSRIPYLVTCEQS